MTEQAWTGAAAGDRVEAMLDRQQELMRALEALSGRQDQIIESEDPEPLLSLLAERQRVIDDIADVGRALEPFRRQWAAMMGSLSPESRERIRVKLDAMGLAAQRICARDEEARRRLEKRRDQAALELGQINRGRGAVGAYSAASPGGAGPRFQDREA